MNYEKVKFDKRKLRKKPKPLCIGCGAELKRRPAKRCVPCAAKFGGLSRIGKKVHTEAYKKKLSLRVSGKKYGKNGKKNPAWNGGRVTTQAMGYILIFSPNNPYCTKQKYVPEHRLVVEKFLGRYLTPKEIVHHINGIKDDNRIENLMLFPNNSAHRKFHTKINQFGFTNPILRQIKNRWENKAKI